MTKKVLRSAATLSAVAMMLVLAGVVFNGTLSAFSAPSSAMHDGRDSHRLFQQGRNIFRFDTFGDQAFWGGTLKLHQAIEGAELRRGRPRREPEDGAGARAQGGCGRDPTARRGHQGRQGRPR